MPPSPEAGGRLSPLRHRGFRWFFVSESVNGAGSAMSAVALAFAVLEVSDSASDLGIVLAAYSVPVALFMLVGGTLADRLPRLLVLRLGVTVQGVAQGLTALLALTGRGEVWQFAALQLVLGTATAVVYPAFHGMVPVLLEPADRKAGYLLLSQSDSLTRVLGPALSGALVATVSPGWALLVDAVSFGVAALLLSLVRLPAGARPDRRPSVLGDLVAGWSYARGLGWVLPVACCSLVFNACIGGALNVLGPVISEHTIGSSGWGLARSTQALGLLAVTLVLARVTFSRPLRVCVLGFTLSALPMVVLGTSVSTLALAAAFLVAGAGLGTIELAWNLTVQEKVDEAMLSRILAIDGVFSFVAIPLGQALAGPLTGALDARTVELGAAALCAATCVAGLMVRPVSRLRLAGPPQAV